MSLKEHRQRASRPARCWIVTLSDTRDPDTDRGGARLRHLLQASGHEVLGATILREDPANLAHDLRRLLDHPDLDALLCTGGTGIARRDLAWDVLQGLYERSLPGFGELFRMLSWEQIGSAAMLSRASAGIVAGRLVFSMPGSLPAIDLALERLILPELGHLLGELQRQPGAEGSS